MPERPSLTPQRPVGAVGRPDRGGARAAARPSRRGGPAHGPGAARVVPCVPPDLRGGVGRAGRGRPVVRGHGRRGDRGRLRRSAPHLEHHGPLRLHPRVRRRPGVTAAQRERDADGRTFARRAQRLEGAGVPPSSSPVVLATALHRSAPGGARRAPVAEPSPRDDGLLGVDVTRDERGAVEAVWRWPDERWPPAPSRRWRTRSGRCWSGWPRTVPKWTAGHRGSSRRSNSPGGPGPTPRRRRCPAGCCTPRHRAGPAASARPRGDHRGPHAQLR